MIRSTFRESQRRAKSGIGVPHKGAQSCRGLRCHWPYPPLPRAQATHLTALRRTMVVPLGGRGLRPANRRTDHSLGRASCAGCGAPMGCTPGSAGHSGTKCLAHRSNHRGETRRSDRSGPCCILTVILTLSRGLALTAPLTYHGGMARRKRMCAAPDCGHVFIPKSRRHRFHSMQCAQRMRWHRWARKQRRTAA